MTRSTIWNKRMRHWTCSDSFIVVAQVKVERDNALQERDAALAERDAALAECVALRAKIAAGKDALGMKN